MMTAKSFKTFVALGGLVMGLIAILFLLALTGAAFPQQGPAIARDLYLPVVMTAKGSPPPTTTEPPPPPTEPPPPTAEPAPAVVAGAGDIVRCNRDFDEATADLLDAIPGTVFTLGDNVYPDGSAAQFRDCYDPSWGRHKERTRPSAGNHDYHTRGAAGYLSYFGAAAGEPGKGYYSYDLEAWHVIVLNSECAQVGGCGVDSAQGQWLQADLAANPSTCTLAYWHKPLFSSDAHHGTTPEMGDFWSLLYAAGADVVVNGHSHVYERFGPQDPAGAADSERGIRQFVVGTGGGMLYTFASPLPNSEVRENHTYGVLKLSLYPTRYEWEFIPIAGQTFTDTGSAPCVGGTPGA
jgi:hypothetical protein